MEWIEVLDFYRKKLASEGKSELTIRNYLHDLKMFTLWYETTYRKPVEISRIQDIDLFAYRSHLQVVKRQKPATVNRHIAALRSFFRFLHQQELIRENLSRNLSHLEIESQKAPEVLTHVQALRLFGSVNKTSAMGKRDFAIIQLFVQCGLRLSELAHIEIGDIETGERKGMLRIPSGKGGKPREVPLNKTARVALSEYLKVRLALPLIKVLFLSQKRKALSGRTIHDIVKKYMEKAGMSDFSCHDLRHLFATNLYNKHKDLILVKEALGHKHIETTLRYSRKTKEEIANALEDTELNIYK
ncbi:hypothetical protein COS91_06665 [Candidatus Desantisbacteria bacterium CG07_land_8_20_14_0_80_39_15]|uniref:Integrase n=1 Tax=Candidatus Desantisbacteria bacterium CG07_land_8_20_14_0_80_39_15 TaxID=1974549 RepID=A0A2M6ZF84_9BACT|nr:MAG: hypothetical protein COS91_06665 [Candidatus Desantisbacteria bacterium CG07_land_8_20_14_0_80_39_15]